MADINSTGRVQLHRSVYASRDRRGSSSDRQQPKPLTASTDALSSETAAPPDAPTPAVQPDPDATVGRHLNLLG